MRPPTRVRPDTPQGVLLSITYPAAVLLLSTPEIVLNHSGDRNMVMRTPGGASVSFSADEGLVERFDGWVEDSQYDNRSEALRTIMSRTVEKPADRGTPLVPPADQRLSKAYVRLVDAANRNGIVRDEFAKTVVSSALGMSKQEVEPVILRKLRERNYLRRQADLYGYVAWEIVGWSDDS